MNNTLKLMAVCAVWYICFGMPSMPASAQAIQLDTTISVRLCPLEADGNVATFAEPFPGAGDCMNDELCRYGNPNPGCQVHPSISQEDYVQPVEFDIEGEYLPNVIAQEVGSALYNETAREAVAIAARTYTHYYLQSGVQINNSISFHAFFPTKFASIGGHTPVDHNNLCGDTVGIQQNYCAALASGAYLTRGTDWDVTEYFPLWSEHPIFTEYAADAYLNTIQNTSITNADPAMYDDRIRHPYLQSVSDPISNDLGIPPSIAPNTAGYSHQRGLSQDGASRWGFGTTALDGFESNLSQEAWSVRWLESDKMLFHYFSGVDSRDRWGNVISPDNRWNILDVDWGTVIEPDAVYQDDSLDGLSLRAANTGPRDGGMATLTIQNTGVTVWDCNTVSLRYSWQRVDGDSLKWVSAGEAPLTNCSSVAPGESFDQQLSVTLPPPMLGEIAYVLTFDLTRSVQPVPNQPSVIYKTPFSSAGWRPWQFRAMLGCSFSLCLSHSNGLSLFLADITQNEGVAATVRMLADDNDVDVIFETPFGTAGKLVVYDAVTDAFLGETSVSATDTTASILLDSVMFDGQAHDLTVKFAPDSATPQAITLDNRFDIVGGLAGYNDDHASDNRGQYEVSLFVPEDGDYVVSTGKTNDVNGNLNLIILELARPADDNIIYSDLYLGLTADAPNATTTPVTLNAGWHVLRFLYSAEYRDNGGDYIWGTISEAPPIALSVGLQIVAAAQSSMWRPVIAIFIGVTLTLYWRKSV